jgi:hypothetical protein
VTEAAEGCWFGARPLGEVVSVGAIRFMLASARPDSDGVRAEVSPEFFLLGRSGAEPMELVVTSDRRGWVGRGSEGFTVEVDDENATSEQVARGVVEQFDAVSQHLPPRIEGDSLAVRGLRSVLGVEASSAGVEQFVEKLVAACAKNFTIQVPLTVPVTVNVPPPEAPTPVKKRSVFDRNAAGEIVGSTTTTVPDTTARSSP